MFGMEKLTGRGDKRMKKVKFEEPEKKNTYELLSKIVKHIRKEEDYTKLKEKVLELSSEWNKELLFEDFENKVRIFTSYEEEQEQVFPLSPWVDSFFEK